MFNRDVFRGKSVLVTGDTGFKGAWLCHWLLQMGANVTGYALPPKGPDDLFVVTGLADRIHHVDGDISDLGHLTDVVREAQPEFVLHLAAQALVQQSYLDPEETYRTNLMGSVNILEAVRAQSETIRSLVFVTSDKCYENKEWVFGYRETDRLGGRDPYSASKAAAELIYQSHACSFLDEIPHLGHASARAGNVIGGGDWAQDRIIPDCINALREGRVISMRNPSATRPWQHVLEPLSGYLRLAQALYEDPLAYRGAWNFGPGSQSNRPVADLVDAVIQTWGSGQSAHHGDPTKKHEAGLLHLNCDKAHAYLQWAPIWDFQTATARTTDWYKQVAGGADPLDVTLADIAHFEAGFLA